MIERDFKRLKVLELLARSRTDVAVLGHLNKTNMLECSPPGTRLRQVKA